MTNSLLAALADMQRWTGEHLAVSPALILIVGALAVPLFKGKLKAAWMLLLPLLGLVHVLLLPEGTHGALGLFDYTLNPLRVDRLSRVFGMIFHIAAFLSVLYALHVRDDTQHVSGLVYAGSAVGAVFAGDLITLFVFWELTAVASVFLIWASKTPRAYRAGMRYLIIQVGSGVLLLSGILLHLNDTKSLEFGRFSLDSTASVLIFLSFGIKCAFPLLHNWLQDAYPEATVTGTVFLSAFTTKMAVYALARGFPGTEMLIWIGAVMTAFPIFYAVIVNDLRRVLAYSLNNQLGFMVVGIGIGTPLALNGTVAHAFAHILYKALLFMSMGAVLYRTGTAKGSELGGLYKSMPWTAVFCMVGAASISAFPLFSGFVSKSLILTAAAKGDYTVVWLVLLFASAGVFHHSGIKIPYFAFFGHDSGKRVPEAPPHMLAAMGITAALCVLIGIFPEPLYAMLPGRMEWNVANAYSSSHVITQLQLLLFSALAFTVLMRTGIYPPETRAVNLDSDWTYRKALPVAVVWCYRRGVRLRDLVLQAGRVRLDRFLRELGELHGPRGILARTWSISRMVTWATVLLAAYLLLYYFA